MAQEGIRLVPIGRHHLVRLKIVDDPVSRVVNELCVAGNHCPCGEVFSTRAVDGEVPEIEAGVFRSYDFPVAELTGVFSCDVGVVADKDAACKKGEECHICKKSLIHIIT